MKQQWSSIPVCKVLRYLQPVEHDWHAEPHASGGEDAPSADEISQYSVEGHANPLHHARHDTHHIPVGGKHSLQSCENMEQA